jgi:hypothetical protein
MTTLRCVLLVCSLFTGASSLVVPANDCFVEPKFSLAFQAGASRNTVELLLRDDAFNTTSNCPLTSIDQLADVDVVSGSRIAINVQVVASATALSLTIVSPVQAGQNIIQVLHAASAGPIFSAPIIFYPEFHLDSARFSNDAGVVTLVGQGRAFPALPKLPGLRLRVRSSKEEADLTQWQLMCTSTSETTVSYCCNLY